MLGAIIGDVVGSRFEHHNIKSKEFMLFTPKCRVTDDSVMTLAVAQALLDYEGDYSNLSAQTVACMQELGRYYLHAGYGGHFKLWLQAEDPRPYNSFGNGAAMRVSPCAHAAKTLEEAKELTKLVTEVSHNHPEGLKGAEATTVAIFMALHGSSKDEIRETIFRDYYPLNFTLDEIRPGYGFDVTCQGSVPQAIVSFLESTNFEDAIRNAISIGGDSDTIAAITGSIAEAYYGIPDEMVDIVFDYLDEPLFDIITAFQSKYKDN